MQDERAEILGESERFPPEEGLGAGRNTCDRLEGAADGDEAAIAEVDSALENSLSSRYFVDASAKWLCPEHEATIQVLLDEGAEDLRATCPPDPDFGDVGCSDGGPDPLG